MKFKLTNKLLLCSMLFALTHAAHAASSVAYNGYRTTSVSDTTFEYSDSLFIGPGAVWEIEGVIMVYSSNIWIAPTAQISGGGTFIIADPSLNPFYTTAAMPTIIDGNNGNFIDLNIIHLNPSNIVLDDLTDPGYGTSNPTGSLAAALKVGNDFNMGIDNGDVILNGNDFVFGESATISDFNENRMVVTDNSIDGHMVKVNVSQNTFTFPVGIEEGDYTPATISGLNTFNVSVQDYANSLSEELVPDEGMDRVWHIFGDAATSITLQHNATSDGSEYIDAEAFITRYEGAGTWSIGSPEQDGSGVHTNSSTIATGIPLSGTDDGAYLTKSSDASTPLPISLLSFDVDKKDRAALLLWSTATEQNNLGFEIEHSLENSNWNKIGFVASKSESGISSSELEYDFTHEKPSNGNNFYRLKIVGKDGRYEYSDVRKVWFDELSKISIFPNPTQSNIYIEGLVGNENIYLYDVLGRLVLQTVAESSSLSIDLSRFANGEYNIIITDANNNATTHKVVKH